jgi:hypothetical protein
VTSLLVRDAMGDYAGHEYQLDVYHTFGGLWILRWDMGLISQDDFQRSLADRVLHGKAVERVDLPAWMVANVTSGRSGWNMRRREDVTGWPALALACHYEASWSPMKFNPSTGGTRAASDEGGVRDGIEVRGPTISRSAGDRASIALPLRPIWPGFAINTVFYAAILWGLFVLLFTVPLALRRRLRSRRGLCSKCGYPVGTSERCSECGAAVTAR